MARVIELAEAAEDALIGSMVRVAQALSEFHEHRSIQRALDEMLDDLDDPDE